MQSKNKNLPLELLVDIFKSTEGSMLKSSKVCEGCEMLFRHVKVLLTSSSIVYTFIGENCQKIWALIRLEKERIEVVKRLREEKEFLEEKFAKLIEIRRRLIEKQMKGIEKIRVKIKKHRKAGNEREIDENGPIAKRTRSHYVSSKGKEK
ncbi:unnamed protein product [Meloidogyne enterolobii]|uniref:Uncharacterized protein n=1 Tax=Meloidogyne enterolobii TaxID=390850 RepID=A0ACB0YQC7_MELEN